MSIIDIEKEDMIKLLLNDDKINVVREAVISKDYDKMLRNERLNYCSEEEIYNICKNEEELLRVIDKYRLTDDFIDIAIEKCSLNSVVFEKIIYKYMELLKPYQIEKLMESEKLKAILSECNGRANDDSTIFLYSKGLIPVATPKQIALIIGNDFKDKDITKLSLDEISIVSYGSKLSPSEVEYVAKKILDTGVDLYMKGYMDVLLQTQDVPEYILTKIVTEWNYNANEAWFERLLMHQNLDCVIDYIFKNIKLDDNAVTLILNNKKTSLKKIVCLYKKYSDYIIKNSPGLVPVLDCHIHMC